MSDPVSFLDPADMAGFVNEPLDHQTIAEMIADATALAIVVAPCIADPEFPYRDAVKAVLRGVLSRWSANVTGGVSSVSAGPFVSSFDSRTDRRGQFWPSEIAQLQSLCSRVGFGTTSLVRVDDARREYTGPDQWVDY